MMMVMTDTCTPTPSQLKAENRTGGEQNSSKYLPENDRDLARHVTNQRFGMAHSI